MMGDYAQQSEYDDLGGWTPSGHEAAAGQTAAHSTGDKPTGFSVESVKANLLAPRGYMRMAQWFFAVVSFAAVAGTTAYPHCSKQDDGYGDEPAKTTCQRLVFNVFVNVVLWLATMVFMIGELLGWGRVKLDWFKWVEFGFDGLWCLFELAAGAAVAQRCNEDYSVDGGGKLNQCELVNGQDSDGGSSAKDNYNAAAAFSIIIFLLLIPQVVMDVKRALKD